MKKIKSNVKRKGNEYTNIINKRNEEMEKKN